MARGNLGGPVGEYDFLGVGGDGLRYEEKEQEQYEDGEKHDAGARTTQQARLDVFCATKGSHNLVPIERKFLKN